MTNSREVSSAVPTERNWMEGLVCPNCQETLQHLGDSLLCPKCRHAWPIVDGVPHFVDSFPYWGEIPLQKMRAVNRRAQEGSWRAALQETGDPEVEKAAEMILNLDRANWQLLLDLPPNTRALDLGAGTGTNSHAMGSRCGEVIALEPVLERIQFMIQRFSQEGLPNVKPVRSSLWVLPFANESFDLVAMNGVLEWVATGQPGNPGELQERALRNVFRLLRPGGSFYLGIENRFSLGYFLGYPDPHCGLPFVTILPRILANWYARHRGQKEGYRNYLYSGNGYCELLKRVGFSRVEIYLALPSYNQPRFLIPFSDTAVDYYVRNFTPSPGDWRRRIALEVIRKLGLRRHVEYAFAILAHK